MEDPMLEESCTHRQSSCLSCWLSFPPSSSYASFSFLFFLLLFFVLVLVRTLVHVLVLVCCCFAAVVAVAGDVFFWRSLHRFSVARIWKKADDATTVLFTLELLVPQQNGKAWKTRCAMFFLLMTWCFLSLRWIDWTCFWLVWSLDYTTEFLKWKLEKAKLFFGFKMVLFWTDLSCRLKKSVKNFGAVSTEVRIFEKGGSVAFRICLLSDMIWWNTNLRKFSWKFVETTKNRSRWH